MIYKKITTQLLIMLARHLTFDKDFIVESAHFKKDT